MKQSIFTKGVDNKLAGIQEGFLLFPDTGRHMKRLAQELLVNRVTERFGRLEREIMAVTVSHHNNTKFCELSHAAVVAHLSKLQEAKLTAALTELHIEKAIDPSMEKIAPLMHVSTATLLKNSEAVQWAVHNARESGFTDDEIHDAILITSAFCMYNMYVKALGDRMPDDENIIVEIGQKIAEHGYFQAESAVKL